MAETRVTTVALEALTAEPTNVRLTSFALEALTAEPTNARFSAVAVEVLRSLTSVAAERRRRVCVVG